jgi:D-3-phosphoglycerate dehydrogenase
MSNNPAFRVGITPDMRAPDGTLITGGKGLALLDSAPSVTYEFLTGPSVELTPAQVAGYDAVLSFGPRYTAATFGGAGLRLMLIARIGVGYDNIDMGAATAAGVLVTIAPDGVRRPMATVILTFVLALAQKLLVKDRLVRSGRWDERALHMGSGLTGRTVGLIGVGNIGREFCRLAAPLEMRLLGHDPYVSPAEVAGLGIELVSLESLLREADFVCVNCPLTEETRGLIGAAELALMKPAAYLINTARGPIVDGAALHAALARGAIAGAGLDVFAQEPVPADDPLLALDNVIVTPHALCWTDECFAAMELSACQAILAVARGEVPRWVVNREALEHPRVRQRLAH